MLWDFAYLKHPDDQDQTRIGLIPAIRIRPITSLGLGLVIDLLPLVPPPPPRPSVSKCFSSQCEFPRLTELFSRFECFGEVGLDGLVLGKDVGKHPQLKWLKMV